MKFSIKLVWLLIFFALTGTQNLYADNFYYVKSSVENQLKLEGYPKDTLNPNSKISNDLRDFLKNKCIYRSDVDFNSSYSGNVSTIFIDFTKFYEDGSAISYSGTTLSADTGGVNVGSSGKQPLVAKWNVFQNKNNEAAFIMLNFYGVNQPSRVRYYDNRVFSMYSNNNDGSVIRYQVLPLDSC